MIIRIINLLRTKFSPYGRCQRCNIAWNIKEHMEPIEYKPQSKAFPLCKQCFEKCSPEEAAAYFIQLKYE